MILSGEYDLAAEGSEEEEELHGEEMVARMDPQNAVLSEEGKRSKNNGQGKEGRRRGRRRRTDNYSSWSEREYEREGLYLRQLYGQELPHFEEDCCQSPCREEEQIRKRREYRRKLEDIRSRWRKRLVKDRSFMLRHRIPFELDDHEKDLSPPSPLCAMLLSPWVDLR